MESSGAQASVYSLPQTFIVVPYSTGVKTAEESRSQSFGIAFRMRPTGSGESYILSRSRQSCILHVEKSMHSASLVSHHRFISMRNVRHLRYSSTKALSIMSRNADTPTLPKTVGHINPLQSTSPTNDDNPHLTSSTYDEPAISSIS